jgi:gliding motility-associated-like protein
VLLTLSWDEATTPSQITNSSTIHIIRWDTNENRWISEGGVIDYETKTVTTIAQVGGYGVFTLAASDDDLPEDDDLIIYNGVSPNDDGDNDYFEIENIQKYPENRVVIFNRWGIKVFETTNYDSRDNVFKGYSDARATLGSGLLPTGTYFYILEYTKTTTDGNSKKIKRSGHLYLKTD